MRRLSRIDSLALALGLAGSGVLAVGCSRDEGSYADRRSVSGRAAASAERVDDVTDSAETSKNSRSRFEIQIGPRWFDTAVPRTITWTAPVDAKSFDVSVATDPSCPHDAVQRTKEVTEQSYK